ncbi:uncharacterized protein V1518DRAFT_404969 [Limtongia smithiae]|uniref:uncharacterized protein n=1 Tax=Limtongia smithiae TaxID=1125753 RepID=UPI0034CFBF72
MPPPAPASTPGTVTTASGITLPMTAAMARSSGISLRTGRPKRKKASRACFHCQKAHLTCDDARPCQRCIKRGLSATCQDGVRKKAKYLHDAPSGTTATAAGGKTVSAPTTLLAASSQGAFAGGLGPRTMSSSTADLSPATPSAFSAVLMTDPSRLDGNTVDPSSLSAHDESPDTSDAFFASFDLSSYDFGSKTANMEFSYLSNMVGTDSSLTAANTLPSNTSNVGNLLVTPQQQQQQQQQQSFDYGFADMTVRDSNWASRGLASLLSGTDASPQNSNSPPTPGAALTLHDPTGAVRGSSLSGEGRISPGLHAQMQVVPSIQQQQAPLQQQLVGPSPTTLPSHLVPTSTRRRRDPETVYASVTQPFSYTPGYHGLIAYLKSRFDRPHLMRLARCMAAFRPSFIACTKTLKEEDLIFMEKCFQRTLLEYEKFISYSGTPTIVWRRTGQVAAVGKEFCILTGWTKDQLLGKRTFVVELMDDHSVLEYFEGFSKLAFGDSRGATMMECTLLSPSGKKIPTACTWTIKRDVFDIPMMIVGNFLPILN